MKKQGWGNKTFERRSYVGKALLTSLKVLRCKLFGWGENKISKGGGFMCEKERSHPYV